MTTKQLPPEIEAGPKMQACSEQERQFVWFHVVEGENQTDAARLAGYVDSGNGAIRRRGHQLAHRERVLEAMEEVGRKTYRTLLAPAINATRRLIEDPKHPDHARTLRATLSSLGFGERTGVDVTVTGEVAVNHTDAALNDLRALMALQVPRVKLEEIFGHTGLPRYEKMLAERERRLAPPVIEHEPAE